VQSPSILRSPREPQPKPPSAEEVLLKIIVVGESGCGKTSYIRQLVEGRFVPNIRSTVGLDFSEKRFVMKDTTIVVQFWDISGQERFASMTRAYYKGAHGAMVCYDVSRPKSFEMVQRWKQDIDSKVFLNDMEGHPIPAILMGNKCDCERKVEISNVELAKYTTDNKYVGWFDTSAKTNYNVREAAEYLVTHVIKHLPTVHHSDDGAMCLSDIPSVPSNRSTGSSATTGHASDSPPKKAETIQLQPSKQQQKPAKKEGCC